MATVYDLLPADQRTRFPLETLTPQAREWLSTEVPDAYPADRRARLGGAVTKIMPRLTQASLAIAQARHAHPSPVAPKEGTPEYQAQRQAAVEEQYAQMPGWSRVVARIANTLNTSRPSLASKPPDPIVPAATNAAERWTDTLTGAGVFVPTATALTMLTGGLGATPLVSGSVGVGGAMALPAGTAKQRAIRGTVGAGVAAVTGPLGMAAGVQAEGLGGALAPQVGTIARHIARAGTAGATFGIMQPEVERRVENATRAPGEPALPAPTFNERFTSGFDMLAFDLMSHGMGAGYSRATARAATPVPTERVMHPVDAHLQRIETDPTASPQMRENAARARAGMQPSYPVGKAGPGIVAAGERAAAELRDTFAAAAMARRSVRATVGGSVRVPRGIISDVRVYPWEEQQVRVLIMDQDTGNLHALAFRDHGDMMRSLEVLPADGGPAPRDAGTGQPAPAVAAPEAAASGGDPGIVPGNDGAPAPVAAATPRPRVVVDMPFRDSKSAQRAADGFNRTNPDLEAKVVLKGSRVHVEVNADAAEAPRGPAAPRPSAPDPAPPAAPTVEQTLDPKFIASMSDREIGDALRNNEKYPASSPESLAMKDRVRAQLEAEQQKRRAAARPPAAAPAAEGPRFETIAQAFRDETQARRWLEGTPGLEGARVVARGESMWDVEAPEDVARAWKGAKGKAAGAAPAGDQGTDGASAQSAPAAESGPMYRRSSGEEIPVRDMGAGHLLNAERAATDEGVRATLRAEIERRGLKPLAPRTKSPTLFDSQTPQDVEPPADPADTPADNAPVEEPAEVKLPQHLAGAKPRYGYGAKNFELDFESDTDRAAFIVSQEKKSRKDAEYRKHLTDQGWTDEEIAAHGKRVRESIKSAAKDAAADKPLRVPRHERQKPAEPPAAEPPAAEPPTPAPAPEPAPAESGPAYPTEHHGIAKVAVGADGKYVVVEGPSAEERAAVAAGVHGKTLAEAAEWLSKSSPNAATRAVAERIAVRLRDMEKQGILEGRVTSRKRRAGGAESGHYSRTFTPRKLEGVKHGITMNPEEGGVTLLHELIHAATEGLLDESYISKLSDPRIESSSNPEYARIMRARADLDALWKSVRAAGNVHEQHTVRYGTKNASELLATGMSDRNMQAFLESIPLEGGTAWTKFVDVVRTALGLERKHRTALDELLRVGDELMRSPGEPEAPAVTQPEPAPTKSFAEAFAEAWSKRAPNDTAEEVAAQVASEMGAEVPPEFDPVAEGARLEREANAAASAGDLFAGMSQPDPAPAAQVEEPAAPASAPPVEGAQVEETPSSSMATTVDTSTLHMHEGFQQRDMKRMGGFTDPEVIQSRLREFGGYNSDEIVKNPVWFWTDTAGEIGPAGRRYIINGHHRYELATNDWNNVDGQFVSRGHVRRTVPAVEIFGDYKKALEAADNANRSVRPPTHIENANMAIALSRRGMSPREIADRMNVKAGAVKSLIDLGHMDSGVLRDYFEERGGKPAVRYEYGEAMGRAVKRHPNYWSGDVQREMMKKIMDGQYGSVSEFEAMVGLTGDVLDAAAQSDIFSNTKFSGTLPSAVTAAAKRAYHEVVVVKEKLSRMIAGLKKAEKETGVSYSKDQMDALQERVARAKKLEQRFSVGRIRDRVVADMQKGRSPEDTLADIRKEVETEMGGESVSSIHADMIESSALDERALEAEEVDRRFMLADLARSTDRAFVQLKRVYGKQFSVLRYISNGKVVATLDLDPPQDTWQMYAAVRLVHKLSGFGGGNVALPGGDPRTGKPGPRDVMHKVGPAATYEITHWHNELASIIGDDGYQQLGKSFSQNDDLFWRAVNAPPESEVRQGHGGQLLLSGVLPEDVSKMTREQYRKMLPPALRDKVEPVAALMRSMLEAENADRKSRGLPEITSRFYDNYITHQVDSITPVDELLTLLDPELAYDPNAMKERKLSVYRRRGGFDDGKSKSFQESFRRYVDTTVTARHDRALVESIRDWLMSTEGAKDVDRASVVRTWSRAWLYREKNPFDDHMNNAARSILFTRAKGATGFLTEKIAVQWLGADAVNAAKSRLPALNVKNIAWQYVDPKKVEGDLTFTDERSWTKVGSVDGLDVYAGTNGHLLAGDPKWRAAWGLASSALAIRDYVPAAWAHVRGGSFTAEMARQQIMREQRMLQYERNPWGAMVAGWNKGMTAAFVGFNFPVSYKIMLSNLGAIHNRYGPITATRATIRSIDMVVKSAKRELARAAYERGEFSYDEYKKRAPALTAEEAAFDYMRLGQGSQLYYRQMAQGEMGRRFTPRDSRSAANVKFNEAVDRLMKPLSKLEYYVGAFGPHAIAEVVTRGIQLHAAWIEGTDRGMGFDGIRDSYEATEEGRRSAAIDILKAAEAPGSIVNHVAAESASTLFTYDRTGQPYYMSSATGRLFGSLSSWGTQSLIHNFLRPLEGAARVGAEMSARPFSGGKDMGWASADHYRAARLFAAQVAGAGLMTYLTDKTRLRLFAGTNTSGLILALMAMRDVYKANHHGAKNEDFERYLADAFAEEAPAIVSSMTKEGREAHGGRGLLGIWFSPFAQTAADVEKRGLLDTALNLATTRIIPYKGQLQKMVRANPAKFRDDPNYRWIADALSVKSFISGTPLERAESTVGLLAESHTKRVPTLTRAQRRAMDATRARRKTPPPAGGASSLGRY